MRGNWRHAFLFLTYLSARLVKWARRKVLIPSQPSTLRSSVNNNQADQNMTKLMTNCFYCPIFLAAMFLNHCDCNINVESWTMLVFLEVPQRLVLVLAGCPIAAESKSWLYLAVLQNLTCLWRQWLHAEVPPWRGCCRGLGKSSRSRPMVSKGRAWSSSNPPSS